MNLFKHLFYTIYTRINFLLKSLRLKNDFFIENKLSHFELKILSELKTFGYSVIENYLKRGDCEIIVKKISSFIDENPDKIYSGALSSDKRIFGAEHVDNQIDKYHNIKFVKTIGSFYMKDELENLMTMANQTTFKKNNLGSGEGWHRDSLNPQFKSILYLTDVNEKNGPFQMVKNSQKIFQIIKDALCVKNKISHTRFSDESMMKLFKKSMTRLLSFNYKAGTLILVDTSCLHRGSPLKAGHRYALTNYYYPKGQIKVYENHFTPMLKKNY